jgi:hypothetical protein
MKIFRTSFGGAAVVASVLVFFAAPVGADSPTPCPDNLVPVPASLVPQGPQKDHNGNGVVCAKYQDGKFVGGPDDTTDDIVP